jgi:signal transduction histidine kinase
VPFLWNVVFTVLSHGLGSAMAPDSMFNHHAGQAHPWTWAFIHGVAVLAACVGVIIFWKNTELEQQRNALLTGDLVVAQTEAAQRQAVSDLFVNLARRNQSLLDRQLELITELEARERTPDALDGLFKLDHLATRIRRNAESLLVLSGDEPMRRWGRPAPLAEVVRAATAEIEDYRRVDVMVTEHLEMKGQAVLDVAHLLAELIENATTFSPPTGNVRVRSYLAPADGSRCVLSIEDTGFGMTDTDLAAANAVLTEPPDFDLRGRTLGFQVVGRLAHRYGLRVRLAHTPGGGLTALVTLPETLVAERTAETARVLVTRAVDPAQLDPRHPGEPSGGHEHDAEREAAPAEGTGARAPAPGRLARRVPGAGLSPLMTAGAPATGPRSAAADRRPRRTVVANPAERERIRSMLSRFQAGARAGRAIAAAPTGSLAHHPREEA